VISRFSCAVLCLMPVCLAALQADHSPPTSPAASAPPAEKKPDDLAYGRKLLQDVRDNVFSFDDPAFYWFCRFVKADAQTARYRITAQDRAVPWRFLLERPSDYRGRLVVVAGRLLRRSQIEVTNRHGVGTLYQCELASAQTRGVCTVIVTDDPRSIPVRSMVRTKAFFIKVRAFRTIGGRSGAGPLLVGRHLEQVGPETFGLTDGASGPGRWGTWLVVGTAVLVVVWLALRWRLRSSPAKEPALGSGREPAASDTDFDWLRQEEQQEVKKGDSADD